MMGKMSIESIDYGWFYCRIIQKLLNGFLWKLVGGRGKSPLVQIQIMCRNVSRNVHFRGMLVLRRSFLLADWLQQCINSNSKHATAGIQSFVLLKLPEWYKDDAIDNVELFQDTGHAGSSKLGNRRKQKHSITAERQRGKG